MYTSYKIQIGISIPQGLSEVMVVHLGRGKEGSKHMGGIMEPVMFIIYVSDILQS